MNEVNVSTEITSDQEARSIRLNNQTRIERKIAAGGYSQITSPWGVPHILRTYSEKNG